MDQVALDPNGFRGWKLRLPMDLDSYLARIALSRRPSRDATGLALVQEAHWQAIGFENLDIMLGRVIRIDSEPVFDKLVRRGRGGYCFEQNRLFADMLGALGFDNRPLLARVLLGIGADTMPPRTHMLLLVDLDGAPWLADAGFGGSYVPPMPLADGALAETADGAHHRLRRIGERGTIGGEWVLERAGSPAATDGRCAAHMDWQAQYVFDLAEVAPVDLEMSNHWTATRPETRFTTLHIASIALPGGFAAMTDRELSLHSGGATQRRTIADAADYGRVLRDLFRIALSDEELARLGLFISR